MSLDIGLNRDTHDLEFIDNDIVIVETQDQLDQTLKIRLLFFQGEWYLDIKQGLPFYEKILVKNPNLPDIDNIIKAEIIDTPEVQELLSYSSDYDPLLRTYAVRFKVRTDFGISEFNETIFGES